VDPNGKYIAPVTPVGICVAPGVEQPDLPPPDPDQVAAGGMVLTDAETRGEGDTWETPVEGGAKVVNTIPPGNGNQTVDQVFYDSTGKIVSRQRVVSNGEGGFQRWGQDTNGRSSYQAQLGPGQNVSGMAWEPGADPAGDIPRTQYVTTADGRASTTVTVNSDGTATQTDSELQPTGSWAHTRTNADGSIVMSTSGYNGSNAKVTGQIDPHGTGWYTVGGQKVETYLDNNANPVNVTTDPDTGDKTYQYLDPATKSLKSNVYDKTGKKIGDQVFNPDGTVKSGSIDNGKTRTTWAGGVMRRTNLSPSDDEDNNWSDVVIDAKGVATITSPDGAETVIGADGTVISEKEAPDTRGALEKTWDGLTGAASGTWDGMKSLVGAGPYGTADTWKALGTGAWNAVSAQSQWMYDTARSATDDNYVASKSFGDRMADVTTFVVGVDFRDFAGDDPWGTTGQAGFGALTLIGPKGAGALRAAGAASKTAAAATAATRTLPTIAKTAAGATRAGATRVRTTLTNLRPGFTPRRAADLDTPTPATTPTITRTPPTDAPAPSPAASTAPRTLDPVDNPSPSPVRSTPSTASRTTAASERALTPALRPGTATTAGAAVRSMSTKLADPAYIAKYYLPPDKNGIVRRKSRTAIDTDGIPVPKAKLVNGALVEHSTPPTIRARFTQKRPTFISATASQIADMTTIMTQRTQALARVKIRQSMRDAQVLAFGKPSDRVAAALKNAHRQRTDLGELLGETAGRHAIKHHYPADKYIVEALHDTATFAKKGAFDQIYKITPHDGGPTRYVIYETKGPSAQLGTKQGPGGKHYEQGTPEYFNMILDKMVSIGGDQTILARRMKRALRSGNVEYSLVRPGVANKAWTGHSTHRFEV